ncbi:MAG: hypothetical protein WCR72_15230 [Bacteroidota bacterium]
MTGAPNFVIQEFIDPVTFGIRGERSIEMIDSRIVSLAQFFRNHFKVSVTINNWHLGGQYKESGTRSFLSKTGAALSQHKMGRAIDMKLEGLDPEHIRREIRLNFALFKAAGLTTIEKDTPTWVHADCRFTGIETLYEVPYK